VFKSKNLNYNVLKHFILLLIQPVETLRYSSCQSRFLGFQLPFARSWDSILNWKSLINDTYHAICRSFLKLLQYSGSLLSEARSLHSIQVEPRLWEFHHRQHCLHYLQN